METKAHRQPAPSPRPPPHPSGLWEGVGISCLPQMGPVGAVDSACVDAETCDVFAHGLAFLILLLRSLCFSLVLSKIQSWPHFYPLERQGNNLTRSRPAKPAENSLRFAHPARLPRMPRSLTGKEDGPRPAGGSRSLCGSATAFPLPGARRPLLPVGALLREVF